MKCQEPPSWTHDGKISLHRVHGPSNVEGYMEAYRLAKLEATDSLLLQIKSLTDAVQESIQRKQ